MTDGHKLNDPAQTEPAVVYRFSTDHGGRITFYSDRSVQTTFVHRPDKYSFLDIVAVEAVREPVVGGIILSSAIVVAGLLPVIYAVILRRFFAGAVIFGLVVAMIGAWMFTEAPREMWHLRVSNSSGESKLLNACSAGELIRRRAQEINEVLFKVQEKSLKE